MLPILDTECWARSNPGVQAVSLQVIVGHLPSGRLPLLSATPAVTSPAAEHHRPLAGTKLHCLVTEAHRCKQLALGCYAALPRAGFEPATYWSQAQMHYRCTTAPPWQRSLDPCNQKCLLWIGRPWKPPVISNHVLVISRRNPLVCIYSNLSHKIGCHGNALCPLCRECHRRIPRLHKSYLKTKLCMGMLHTTEVMAIFVIVWNTLAKIWLPWQRPLEPCNQKCLLSNGRPRKSPVISNHVLVVSRINLLICIYSNFSPKIGCHGNPLCPMCRGVSQINFPIT